MSRSTTDQNDWSLVTMIDVQSSYYSLRRSLHQFVYIYLLSFAYEKHVGNKHVLKFLCFIGLDKPDLLYQKRLHLIGFANRC